MTAYNRERSIRVCPGRVCGAVCAPPSKSISHRMLICAALAAGESTLRGVSLSQDVCATIDALSALGAQVIIRDTSPAGATVCVRGIGGHPRPCGEPLRCRESGSTLRFVIPLCMLSEQGVLLRGSARLFRRPLAAYRTLFSSRWGEQATDEMCPAESGSLEILGGDVLLGGEYQLEGDISSQFISGLLFALPLCEKDSRIVLNSIPESRPYIDLTLDALRRFGVRAWWDDARTLCVPGGQAYRPHDGAVEGDASGAAFFGALNAFGGQVLVTGLSPDSLQGDRVYAVHIATLMAHRQDGGEMPCIDLADCPDLAPILFTVAAEHGGATFTHTERLRTKECDRIAAMQQELAKFGARLTAEDAADSVAAAAVGGIVRVLPSELHAPCEPLDGHNDHRVVMSLAVIATKYGGVIRGAEAVAKSMPDFFDRMRALGVVIEEM